jgi:hypothetical protein
VRDATRPLSTPREMRSGQPFRVALRKRPIEPILNHVFSHDWQIDWFASIVQKNGSGGLEELYSDDYPVLFKARQASSLDSSDPGYPVVSTVMDEGSTKMHGYTMRRHGVLSQWVYP